MAVADGGRVVRASVIIPTRDRAEDLSALLDGVRASRLAGREVIVVDDASRDSTAELCRSRGDVRLIRLERGVGPAAARNLGAAGARGEVLVFVDSDVLLDPRIDVLAEIVETLERRPDLDYVLTASDVTPRSASAVAYNYSVYHAYYMDKILAGRHEAAGRILFFTTRLGAIRRERFRASGGFHEGLWTVMNEDGEFGARCYHLGYRGYFRRDFVHRHRFPTRLGRFVRNYFLTAMVQALIDAKMDTRADPSIGAAEKARRLGALAALAASAALPFSGPPVLWCCLAAWSFLLLSLRPLHRLLRRHVPARFWPGWHLAYVAVTPAIVAGYAVGRSLHALGASLLRGRPSSLPYFQAAR